MSNFFKCNVFSMLAVGSCLGLWGGCGGGGSGTPSGTPTPFDGTYQATVTPTDAVPGDGQVPTATLNIVNGRATSQLSFFLQPSVVSQVQQAIDDGLTSAGYASAIPSNQVPASVQFSATSQLDASGKAVFTSTQDINVCGRATLALEPTFASTATGASGQGNYNISFPNNLTIRVSGQNVSVAGTCNNLPLRAGTVTFVR